MASSSSSARPAPRIILYYQTTHDPKGNLISTLPLLIQPDISLTHLIVAAIHINEDPDGLTLNDHPPSDQRYTTMWAELRVAQACNTKVLGMLGGAAKGSFTRLDQDQATFEKYYGALHELIKDRSLDGLDLDVEEEMSLAGIVRLIDRLRADFGPAFLITLAPVAAALLDPRRNLSGFDYAALEAARGPQIAWYNAQFYCGWGDAGSPDMYRMCVARGWPADKIVLGLVTSPDNSPGWVSFGLLAPTLAVLRAQFPGFGGVMGWEYFNALPGDMARPWEWAQSMTKFLNIGQTGGAQDAGAASAKGVKAAKAVEVDPDVETDPSLEVPQNFEYYSDGLNVDDD
ncbi:glycoside hydrolase family 18 protein [Annulohypoxylon bovei var. microspora]|nr:glycoside hydrolase family 18 protein [Annulohypoxylon bovei var. microspora]